MLDLVIQIAEAKLGEITGDADGGIVPDIDGVHFAEFHNLVVGIAGGGDLVEAFMAKADLLADENLAAVSLVVF